MDKIICVGKNYIKHAIELGGPIPEMPVLFLKPPSTAVFARNWGDTITVELPRDKGTVHYECEILVRIDASGKIKAVTLGLDLTLRERQTELKNQGHPWERAKVFKNSAIIGPWIPIHEFPNYLDQEFSLETDGVVRQKAKGKEMRINPEACITYSGQNFPICEDDILFTGTPAGVGPLLPGQTAKLNWGGSYFFEVRCT